MPMDFRTRINAVLHGDKPDQVPLAPYDNLVPRGAFVRQLRNRGMGLLLRRPVVWSERPNVRVERAVEGDIETTTYHTPVGSVFTRRRQHLSRTHGGRSTEIEGLIKGVEDIDTVIFMVEDTVYHADPAAYVDANRDVGQDGIVRITGPSAPYDRALGDFGYSTAEGLNNWVYTQMDHPDHLQALIDAYARDVQKLLPFVVDSPGELVALGSVNGLYGPRQFQEHVLAFYQEVVPYLQSRGKICTCHAHLPQLASHAELLRATGARVIEAFTPPPVGDLSVAEARRLWGDDVVIWINFPETVFYSGQEATRDYAMDLIRSDAPGDALVIGFTETGLACIVDDEAERVFCQGFEAVMEAIEACGAYPVQG